MAKRALRHRALATAQATSDLGGVLLPATVGAPLLVTILLAPLPSLLPVLSIVSIAAAALVALLAWRAVPHGPRDRVSLWDVSGAWALIGVAAGILGGPERAVQLLASLGP